jgi:peptidoglycan/LPS O-acetylase OafA/YrhL
LRLQVRLRKPIFICVQNARLPLFQNRSTPITATAPVDSSRDNHFQFLRLLFATLVIFAHSFELIDGNRKREPLTAIFGTLTLAEMAVIGFFILSGYLIVQSWQRSASVFDFLKKRVLRIYPAYVVAFFISVLIVGRLGAGENYFAQLNLWKIFTDAITLTMPRTPPVFDGTYYPLVNGAMWTIVYEFRCYLLVAVLGVLGAFKKPQWWLALTIAATAFTALSFYASRSDVEALHFPGAQFLIGSNTEFSRLLACFGAGGCYYLFRDKICYHRRWALEALAVTAMALFYFPAIYPAIALAGAYCLFAFAFTPIKILDRFKTKTDISYGIYLYGWPTQKLLLWYFPLLSPLVLFGGAFAISIACGWLSWKIIEAPFLRLKKARFLPAQKMCAAISE